MSDDDIKAYVGYDKHGDCIMITVDDGSAEMHRQVSDHIREHGPGTTKLVPAEQARHEIMATISKRKAEREARTKGKR